MMKTQADVTAYGRFAAVYDTLMGDVDYDGWEAYLVSLLEEHGVKPGASVLDCACGTGQISIRLAKRGYQVTGLDVSEAMLEIAQQKARMAGLQVPAQLPFIRQDMRRIALHRPVDAVVCACDGVNYLTSTADFRRFLSAAKGVLRPGGLLLFDMSSRYKLSEVLGNRFMGEDREDLVYLWQNTYDEQNHLLEMRLNFFIQNGSLYERFTEQHLQRAHSEREAVNALQAEGFAHIAVYGDFTHQPPEKKAQRLQFLAVKPA